MQASSAAGPSSHPSSSSAAGKPDRLYVGNLSPTVDEYTLIQVFSKFGKITKLDFMFHKTGAMKGKPRGFAFIQFSDKDDALKAMVKLHDRLLRGRKLVVTYASSAPVDNLPYTTKGRRPNEPAKTTTLSLLKANKKPQSAAAQIAAMEAKLASMARDKPAGEDWVPGNSGSASRAGSTADSKSGTPVIDGAMKGGSPDEEALGDVEGERAADALEKEMKAELLSDAGHRGADVTGSDEPSTKVDDVVEPSAPGPSDPGHVASTKENKETKRGLAGLPRKPVF